MDDFSQLKSKETKKQIGFIKKYINKITNNKKLKKIKRNLKKNKRPKEKKLKLKILIIIIKMKLVVIKILLKKEMQELIY